jgi:hypothetical protein
LLDLHAVIPRAILNNLGIGDKYFHEYAQWDSDKTAKTDFVGFDITYPGDLSGFSDGIFRCFAE